MSVCLEGYKGECISVKGCQVYGVNATGVTMCQVWVGGGGLVPLLLLLYGGRCGHGHEGRVHFTHGCGLVLCLLEFLHPVLELLVQRLDSLALGVGGGKYRRIVK